MNQIKLKANKEGQEALRINLHKFCIDCTYKSLGSMRRETTVTLLREMVRTSLVILDADRKSLE